MMKYFNKQHLVFFILISSLFPAVGKDAGEDLPNKYLNFREKILSKNEIDQLNSGAYEEIDLGYTDIKKYGLTIIQSSKDTLQDLDIEGNALDKKDLGIINLFTKLQVLNVANNYLEDSDLETISSLSSLRNLNIQYNCITANGIHSLKKLINLEVLDFGFIDLKKDDYIFIINELKTIKTIKTINIRSMKSSVDLVNVLNPDNYFNSVNISCSNNFFDITLSVRQNDNTKKINIINNTIKIKETQYDYLLKGKHKKDEKMLSNLSYEIIDLKEKLKKLEIND